MSSAPPNSEGPQLALDPVLPEGWQEARNILNDDIREINYAVNAREVSIYETAPQSTGQRWFTADDNQTKRGVKRKVVNFGALPDTTSSSVAHGITVTANTLFTKITAVANDPSTKFVPLPWVKADGSERVEIYADGTNVVITTNFDATGYTTCYVILEYMP